MSRRLLVLVFLMVAVLALSIAMAACATPTPQVVEKVVKETVAVPQTVVVAGPTQVVQQTVVVAGTPQVVEKIITSTPPPQPTKPGGVGVISSGYNFPEGSLLLTPQPDLIAKFQLKPDYKASKPIKIAYITKHLVNQYFVATDKGVQARCQQMGVQCTTFAPQIPDNPEEQIRLVEDAVNKKFDAIVIYAVDSKAVSPAIKKAEAAGIPVVGLGTVPFDTKLVTFISADYYTRSYDLGKILANKIGGKGIVVTIDGVPGAQNAKDMKSGYLAALNEFPGIQVLASQTGYWKRPEGMAAMENLLQRFPQIDGVVAADDESGLGAIQALEAAGRKGVPVIGFNASHDGLCAIAAGRMLASDDADPGGLSAAGAEVAVRYVLDKEQFPPEIPWPLPGKKFYVTKDNIAQFWPRAYSLSEAEKAAGKCQ